MMQRKGKTYAFTRWAAVLTAVLTSARAAANGDAPPVFASAEAASQALYQAVQRQDEPSIIEILGGGKALITVGDPFLDSAERQRFAAMYQQMHRLISEPEGNVVLAIGAENWPFPIPLVEQRGAWHFDADAGQAEVLARRIGQNEIAAIELCQALIAAARHDHATPAAADARFPVASLLAKLRGGKPFGPLQGYYFRALSGPAKGEPGFVAWPAAYRQSGVMTFIAGKGDVIYEKDFGPETIQQAEGLIGYHPDSSWTVSVP